MSCVDCRTFDPDCFACLDSESGEDPQDRADRIVQFYDDYAEEPDDDEEPEVEVDGDSYSLQLATLRHEIQLPEASVSCFGKAFLSACATGIVDLDCECELDSVPGKCDECGHYFTCLKPEEVFDCLDLGSHMQGFKNILDTIFARDLSFFNCCPQLPASTLSAARPQGEHLFLCPKTAWWPAKATHGNSQELHLSQAEKELIDNYRKIQSARKYLQEEESRLREKVVSISENENWVALFEDKIIAKYVTRHEKRFNSSLLKKEEPKLYERFRKPMLRGYLKIFSEPK